MTETGYNIGLVRFFKVGLVQNSWYFFSFSIQSYTIIKFVPGSPCASAPCYNGGTCTNDGEEFKCNCPIGFIGERCNIKGNLISRFCYLSMLELGLNLLLYIKGPGFNFGTQRLFLYSVTTFLIVLFVCIHCIIVITIINFKRIVTNSLN